MLQQVRRTRKVINQFVYLTPVYGKGHLIEAVPYNLFRKYIMGIYAYKVA